MCSSPLCTIVAHNTAQNRPDNFPSCPPDNHNCSDDVYLRERGLQVRVIAGNIVVVCNIVNGGVILLCTLTLTMDSRVSAISPLSPSVSINRMK